MAEQNWIDRAVEVFRTRSLEHRNYSMAMSSMTCALGTMMPGEILVIVGPSRVGKTRLCRSAFSFADSQEPDANGHMPTIFVEAENASTSGEFSTKTFMADALSAIRQPQYGINPPGDNWGVALQGRIRTTSEGMLRTAFERALQQRGTTTIVIDEAQHVGHARGGPHVAARILDSWKCIGNKTGARIVLCGTYKLLELLPLSPHLLGRQHPLEFARYRPDQEDREAWESLLLSFSQHLQFGAGCTLLTWDRLLYEGTQGCIGHLSRWLRNALGMLQAGGGGVVTERLLVQSRMPALHEEVLAHETLAGERELRRRTLDCSEIDVSGEAPANEPRKRKPFQRKSVRSKADARS